VGNELRERPSEHAGVNAGEEQCHSQSERAHLIAAGVQLNRYLRSVVPIMTSKPPKILRIVPSSDDSTAARMNGGCLKGISFGGETADESRE
jgi:hypothetical protein